MDTGGISLSGAASRACSLGSPSPALLVAVGAFGKDVARATTGTRFVHVDAKVDSAGKPAELTAKEPFGEVLCACERELSSLLDVTRYLETSSPTDPRGPRCDVFVVADLSEPGVAPLIAPLSAALATSLRRAFSPILRSGDGALVVCTVLVCPRAGDRLIMSRALMALADVARVRHPSARLGGRVYLVEDQSGKYIVPRAELVRSFAAFLSALVLPAMRDDDRGARMLVEDTADNPTFSTFACASLSFDHAALGRLAAARFGREILDLMRAAVDPAAVDIASLAAPLVPDRARLEADLAEPIPLLEFLSPPKMDVPTIDWDDDPETIVEHKFGSIFAARTEALLRTFEDEVERFQMDKLSAALEQRGKGCMERVLAALDQRVAQVVATGPTGHARALLALRDARTRARGYYDEVVRAVEAPELSERPASPLSAKLSAIEEAARLGPRPLRMKVLGAAASVVSSIVIGGLFVTALRMFVLPYQPFFAPVVEVPSGPMGFALIPPIPFLVGAAVSVPSTSYRLWKHRKRHHNWVVEARDDLAQALERHVREALISHYERRLHHARLLWIQRILSRLLGRIEETIAALEAIRAVLAEADRSLRFEEADGQRSLSAGGMLISSALHGSIVRPDDVDDIYDDVRPPEPRAATERWMHESLAEHPWTDAPFGAVQPLLEFCHRELASLDDVSPFEPGESALHRAAEDAARRFLRRLFLKLSAPLEVAPKHAPAAPAPQRVLFAPPEARALVDAVLADGGFDSGWDVRGLSPDRHAIVLVVARSGLPLESIALARPEEP